MQEPGSGLEAFSGRDAGGLAGLGVMESALGIEGKAGIQEASSWGLKRG